MTRTDDERHVAALLHDAVSTAEPAHALGAIRARTSTRRRPWAYGAAGAVAATAATVAAVVALTHGGTPARTDGPTGGAGVAGQRATGTVYFVGRTGAGARLFPERHPARSGATALDQAVDDAVRGRSLDPDYRSPWPEGTVLQRAQLSGGVLSVDLSGPVSQRPAGMTAGAASLALQQVVWTAQAAAGSQLPVTFLVDGSLAPTVLGRATSIPVPAAAADDTLSAVQVATPVDGAVLRRSFTVSGQASAYEANVQWELHRGGTVVRQGFATAPRCCTLSPYSFRVTAPPGAYTLVVHDEDVGEGPPPTRDTKRVTVR